MSNFNRRNANMGRRHNSYDRDGYDRSRYNVNPWQGGVIPNSGGFGAPSSTNDATIALASNLINFMQSRQSNMPSLLDLNLRRDAGSNYMRDDRFGSNRIGRNMQMGGQMNRRVVSGGRNDRGMNKIRRPMKPNTSNKGKSVQKNNQDKKETSDIKAENVAESENGENQNEEETDTTNKDDTTKMDETSSKDGDAKSDRSPKKNEIVKQTEFDGITSEFLECHICEKKMWDGRSFVNHIKGRVHNIMMDKTKQSYHMTADAMRQELKIHEMKMNKRGFPPVGAKRVFCAMCDLYIYNASAHRRSPGHQKLKKYLHPSCNTCRKEFPTRLELDEHRLTAPHMRLLQEKQKDVQSRPKPEVVMISTLQEELSKVIASKQKKAIQVKKEDENESEVKGETEGEVKMENDGEEVKIKTEKEDEEEKPTEAAVVILDYKDGDDLNGMCKDNVPKYQTDRPVGTSFLADFTCKWCTLCKKYFDTDETAEVHLRTWKHFQNFIRLLHSKIYTKPIQDAVGKREFIDEDNDEGDGNWKRRKVEVKEEDVDVNGDTTHGDGSFSEDAGNTTNYTTDVTMESNITASFEESTFNNEDISSVTQTDDHNLSRSTDCVEVEKPRATRGRGRGRGNRARRASRY